MLSVVCIEFEWFEFKHRIAFERLMPKIDRNQLTRSKSFRQLSENYGVNEGRDTVLGQFRFDFSHRHSVETLAVKSTFE